MFSEEELANSLSRVVVGSCSLADFEDWFVPRSWNPHRWAPPELRDAIYSIELELAEHSNRHVDANHVRIFLGDLASRLGRGLSIAGGAIGAPVHSEDVSRAGLAVSHLQSAA